MRRPVLCLLALLPLTGCQVLNDFNEAVEDFNEASEDITKIPKIDTEGIFDDLSLVSVVPTANYSESGLLDFSLVSSATSMALGEEMKVQVKNRDGSFSDCEREGGEHVPAHEQHVMAMLIDGSGSMELSYPPREYGDVCPTCPHDPERKRLPASATLIRLVQNDSPNSHIAVGEFGPDLIDPSSGFSVTTLHHDFSTDTDSVAGSLNQIRGDEEYGTPLYDSVAEMVLDAASIDLPGERSVIVLTDGLDNKSERYNLGSLIRLANENQVKIYTVGLGPASSNGPESSTEARNIDAILALQDLSSATGGFYAAVYDPFSMDDLYHSIATTFTEGYKREKYHCVPKDTETVPHDQCGCPTRRGEPLSGRMMVAGQSIPWNTVAPE